MKHECHLNNLLNECNTEFNPERNPENCTSTKKCQEFCNLVVEKNVKLDNIQKSTFQECQNCLIEQSQKTD